MTRPLRRLVAPASCLVALIPFSSAWAQPRIVLETADVVGPGAAKLTPELDAARRIRGRLSGFTAEGRAVLRLPRRSSIADHERALAATPGVRGWRPLGGQRVIRTTEVIAFFAPGRPPADATLAPFPRRRVHETRLREARGDGSEPWLRDFVVLGTPAGITGARIDALVQDANVLAVEPNVPHVLTGTAGPNDPDYGSQWGLPRVGAENAWQSVTSSPVIVAVLDTGIDHEHQDLAANVWTNAAEEAGAPGVDDDSNGLVDDVHGYDFVAEDGDSMDGHGHGTQAAGIIGAVGDNGKGIAGVVWDVEIMAVRIFDDGLNVAFADDIARGMDYARLENAKVLCNSWAGPRYSSAIADAIERAELDDVLVVCAAGNGGWYGGSDNDVKPLYPASYWHDNVVTVMATTALDTPWSLSNFGHASVDVAAPGESILTTGPGDGYGYVDGTSFAAPFVAGAAALVLGHPDHGGATVVEVKDALMAHARAVPALDDLCVSESVLDVSFLGPEPAGAADLIARPSEGGPRRVGEHPEEPRPSPGEPRTLTGTLVHPAFAIGGETTGTVLRTAEGPFELDVSGIEDADARLSRLDRKPVVVEGILRVVRGVEIPRRRIVTVTSIEPGEDR